MGGGGKGGIVGDKLRTPNSNPPDLASQHYHWGFVLRGLRLGLQLGPYYFESDASLSDSEWDILQ